MAVAFDAQGHIDTGAASATFTSLSGTPITIGSGSNRALAVCLTFSGSNALPTGITVTCGGVAMTAITNASTPGSASPLVNVSCIWFGLVAPASGTPTIAAAWTGNRSCVMGAISVTGADQTGGVTTFAHGASHATGTLDASWTVTITSAVGNLTAACYVDDGGTTVSSTSATQDWLDNTCFGNFGAMNHTAGSASNVMTATPSAAEATTAAGFDFVASTGVFLRPDADSILGSWTNELGDTTLFSSIDETVASDTDYIQSAVNPSSDITKISLSDPASGVGSPVIVSYRYKKRFTPTASLTVRLLQGVTQIASWSHSDISGSFVTTQQTLTAPQLASITDFTDLYLEFTANS